MQVTDAAAGQLRNLAAIARGPGRVPQTGLGTDRLDRDLMAVLAVGLGGDAQHHSPVRFVLKERVGIEGSTEVHAVHGQQVCAVRHLLSGSR